MPEKIAGDIITEDLHRIFASTYDGDPRPLERLVEGDAVDEYVRSAAIRTFLVLEATGQMSREAVVTYFRSLFEGKMKRDGDFVWSCLANAVADLPAPELLDHLRRAYADGLPDEAVADLRT